MPENLKSKLYGPPPRQFLESPKMHVRFGEFGVLGGGCITGSMGISANGGKPG